MITTDNLHNVLEFLGFTQSTSKDIYNREYEFCSVSVDFFNKKIIYPEDKGFIVNDKTTSNFEHPENFVVLECVCNLLNKGYRPEHIELEPKWLLGEDKKSGKADILVKDEKNKPLIIIECKKSDKYKSAKKKTEETGGQLFGYWQQELDTKWLALYTSNYMDGKVQSTCECIQCFDDENLKMLGKKDNSIKLYVSAKNEIDHFNVWKETYKTRWQGDVIFDYESQAYKIGIPPLRKNKLKEFNPSDHIVNSFEEILRHNNVSDKENAFNRLVALFICKLVDEIKKKDSDVVDFQYKQGQDTYESLQDRLQHLHQLGMEEFMKEKIFYVDANYAEKLFLQYTGRKRKAAIDDLNRTIRILKYYSNNDFAFMDVHNEELFYQNGKILVEVVQLFQPYRIVYPYKHQFLGDLFERLLRKGFKQDQGQYFTPTPITRFIWDSLPIQDYINKNDLPRVIDFSCGAGHFLTEAVEAINAVRVEGLNNKIEIDKVKNDYSWVEKHLWGVEKDYRLARVSKISMFMNGAGGCNIKYGDGLENYQSEGIEPSSFDILVANPPFAIKGFKDHLKLRNDAFTILGTFTLQSGEIESLFVERMQQLVKPNGLAAIILPDGVLGGKIESYIEARKIIIKHFAIRSIVDLGYGLFGATETKTEILFLEKYNEPPRFHEIANDIVEGILENGGNSDWEDSLVLKDYVRIQNIDSELYCRFLRKKLSRNEMSQSSYLKEYVSSFAWDSVKANKEFNKEEKAYQLNKFYEWALSIEKEKLYYFSLVHKQKTIIISAPSDTKERKNFFGFDWSIAKKNEGIKIINPGGKLYDNNYRFSEGTLAYAIRKSFSDYNFNLKEDVKEYCHTYWLRNLINFSGSNFNIEIQTSEINNFRLESQYPVVKLIDYIDINKKQLNPKKNPDKEFTYVDISSIESETGRISLNQKIIGKNAPSRARRLVDKGDTIISTVRPHLRAFAFADCEFENTIFSTGFAVLSSKNKLKLLPKLIFIYFMNLQPLMDQILAKMPKGLYPSINKTDIESLLIPLPPISIQKDLIKECEKIDNEYNNSRMRIETYRQKISKIFDKYKIIKDRA